MWVVYDLTPKVTDRYLSQKITPYASTLSWDQGKVTIETNLWGCLQCKELSGCECRRAKDRKPAYYDKATPQNERVTITMRICHTKTGFCTSRIPHAHHTKNWNEVLPLQDIDALPHHGKEPRPELEFENDDSEYSTTPDELSEESDVESKPHAAISAWISSRLRVRTRYWFTDWCRDPECIATEAQHRHQYFAPHGQERDEWAECTWYTCRDQGCRRSNGPHAHQQCYTKQRQTLPMTYFQRLPRTDTESGNRRLQELVDALNRFRKDDPKGPYEDNSEEPHVDENEELDTKDYQSGKE